MYDTIEAAVVDGVSKWQNFIFIVLPQLYPIFILVLMIRTIDAFKVFDVVYVIPVTLGETEHYKVLPAYNREVILGIRHFVVENIRTARRFLKKTEPSLMIDELHFYELNKHTSPHVVAGYLTPLAAGESVGIISEAGCPTVADPGADIVAIAQRKRYKVEIGRAHV